MGFDVYYFGLKKPPGSNMFMISLGTQPNCLIVFPQPIMEGGIIELWGGGRVDTA